MYKSSDMEAISELYVEMVSVDVVGTSNIEGGIANGDDYAEGDARVPKILGTYSRKGKVKRKKKKKVAKSKPLGTPVAL